MDDILSPDTKRVLTGLSIIQEQPIDIHGAAIVSKLSVHTLYKKCSMGQFPHHKLWGKLHFFESEILDFIKNNGRMGGQSK